MASVAVSKDASQGPILRLIDFVDEIVEGKERARHNIVILVTYFTAMGTVFLVWENFSDKDFSFLLTLSGIVQTLSFFLLLHKVRTQRTANGISSKMLQVYALAFMFRLSSTLFKNGYLPVDKSGDWVYQASDVASLLLVFQLLYLTHKRYAATYQQELDSLPVWRMVPVAIVFSCLFHGNLNHSPAFDSAWTAGLWLDTFAMLPQLWMLVAKHGEVEALTSNFVALIFASRVMSFWFWFSGLDELAPKEGGFNTTGALIMSASVIQLLFSADFMYHYFMWSSTVCESTTKSMVLPVVLEV